MPRHSPTDGVAVVSESMHSEIVDSPRNIEIATRLAVQRSDLQIGGARVGSEQSQGTPASSSKRTQSKMCRDVGTVHMKIGPVMVNNRTAYVDCS